MNMKTLIRLSKMVTPLLPVMLMAVILGAAGHICAISIPVMASIMLYRPLPLFMLFAAGVLRGILHYGEQYCNHFIAFTVLARIRSIVFKKLRQLGPAKLECKQKGDLISLITNDIELLEVFYAHTISPVCIALTVETACCIFLAHYSIILSTCALLSYISVGILIPLITGKKAEEDARLFRKSFSEINAFILDCIRGIEQTILFGNGLKKLNEIQKNSRTLSSLQKKMTENDGKTSALTGLFITSGSLLMLFIALRLKNRGLISHKDAITAVILQFSSFAPVIALANLSSGLSSTIAAGKRVLTLLEEKPAVNEMTNGTDIEFNGAELEKVSFCYKQGTEILKNLSINFQKGRIIGIKGKSGSGKSTVLKLLMRFYDTSSGRVIISGTDIEKINSTSLKNTESYISQETILFHDSIKNNIKIAKLNATDQEIEEACKKARIHDFIQKLPDRYNTEVAELGDNFSGGERQRLGLARSFLHAGDFLLLDEPTSNLDSHNEKLIMDAVKEESKGKTVVIVSHRESSFEHADIIYELQKKKEAKD